MKHVFTGKRIIPNQLMVVYVYAAPFYLISAKSFG